MGEHFVKLACTGCGARLEIYDDMDRFTCGYCGTSLMAKRRGGTVAISSLVDGIEHVREGTDRTANELSLQRLSAERDAMALSIQTTLPNPANYDGGIAAMWLFLAAASLAQGFSNEGVALALVVFVILGVVVGAPFHFLISSLRTKAAEQIAPALQELAALDDQISAVRAEIAAGLPPVGR